MIKEEKILLKSQDGLSLALWKIYSDSGILNKHVFLTHGTFSDKGICNGISRFYVKKGFTAWILEWRNHGDSAPSKKFNFETVAMYDIATAFKFLFHELKINNLHCVTHSGGGICLIMFLIKNPIYQKNISSIVLFSCQAFGAGLSFVNHLRILLSKYICLLLGFVPGKKLGIGKHNESYTTMKQWFNWNLHHNFFGLHGFDYKAKMSSVFIPILSICSGGDNFIAPPYGCRAFLEKFENPNNNLLYCSISSGFKEDYNHSRVILSKNSAYEIWPLAYQWSVKNHQPLNDAQLLNECN